MCENCSEIKVFQSNGVLGFWGFGDLGIKKTSAQITTLYSKEDLLGKQIVANVNFAEKQIANFMSQCLIVGAVDSEKVILLSPEDKVPNGTAVR